MIVESIITLLFLLDDKTFLIVALFLNSYPNTFTPGLIFDALFKTVIAPVS